MVLALTSFGGSDASVISEMAESILTGSGVEPDVYLVVIAAMIKADISQLANRTRTQLIEELAVIDRRTARFLELLEQANRLQEVFNFRAAAASARWATRFVDDPIMKAGATCRAIQWITLAIGAGQRRPDRRTALHVASWADWAVAATHETGAVEISTEAILSAIGIRHATDYADDLRNRHTFVDYFRPRGPLLLKIAAQFGELQSITAADLLLRSVQLVGVFQPRAREKVWDLIQGGRDIFGPGEERFVMAEASFLCDECQDVGRVPPTTRARLNQLLRELNDFVDSGDMEVAFIRDVVLWTLELDS